MQIYISLVHHRKGPIMRSIHTASRSR